MGKPNVFHNLFRLKARDFIILLSFIVLLTGTVSFGQSPVISITIAVSPPYSSKIQDYTNQPNKLMATILNKSGKSQTIYLQGSVTGQGGIRVCTNPMYKPPAITVMPGVPFLMSMSNLQQRVALRDGGPSKVVIVVHVQVDVPYSPGGAHAAAHKTVRLL